MTASHPRRPAMAPRDSTVVQDAIVTGAPIAGRAIASWTVVVVEEAKACVICLIKLKLFGGL